MSALLNQIMFWVNVVTEKSNISDVQHLDRIKMVMTGRFHINSYQSTGGMDGRVRQFIR